MRRFAAMAAALTPPLALIGGPALADPEPYGHMTYWGNGYGIGMMLGPVLWLIVLGVIVAGIVLAMRRDERTAKPGTGTSARDALDLRFAKGEIDPEDYAARKALLSE